jgi:hypothetical protein
MTSTIPCLPRHGKSEQVATANVCLGELIYLTDKECLAVGDGKGGYTTPVSVVKGPNNGLYSKVEDSENKFTYFIPLYIRHDF